MGNVYSTACIWMVQKLVNMGGV